MKLIVGLGNPGSKYAATRHNAGFEAVDLVASRHGLTWETAPRGIDALSCKWMMGGAIVAKPLTFMNRSGEAVVGLLQFYKIEVADLLVIVDEVQLEAGRIRLRPAGSAGGHNGLKSIIQSLGTEAFPRLRIGVGRGDAQRDLTDHVLGRVGPAERPVIEEAIGRAADAAELFVEEDIMSAMNRFNRKDDVVKE
ncbi:MAG TPA: aminoacyl-tRNA hydrolase [Vicinamibacterales bacterium]|jgi:PTH1 family peptidyl-tRNA hydrolase|nr:aminoacyl-tRNA hydrolase [Vicinamibacterales bacterium]